jgi:hypothetical protein
MVAKEEEQTPSPMSSLPSTPERLASQSTDNDTEQRIASPEFQKPGPCNRRVRSAAHPGSTRPVTPQTTSSGSNDGEDTDSDKENVHPSNYTDNDDPYCTANLHLLWQLAEQAIRRWGQDTSWPEGVGQHGMDIFMVNTTPRPETLDDLSQYMVDKIPAIFGTLKAWEDELTVQKGQTMGGTFVEDVGGFTIPERERTRTNALLILPKEQVPMARSALNLKQSIHYDKHVNAAIMKELGWKKYGDDFDLPDIPYLGEGGGLQRTKWVRYNLSGPNPLVEGTDGPDENIYTQDLHAVPQAHPNFDEAKGFQNDRLQIFHLAFKSRMLVD